MTLKVHYNLRRVVLRPAWIVAACCAAVLSLRSRSQQQAPPSDAGESPSAIDAEEITPGEQMGEPDDLNAADIANAVGEAEAEMDVFFFSSRRRHTRSLRDWSSDVCSSD